MKIHVDRKCLSKTYFVAFILQARNTFECRSVSARVRAIIRQELFFEGHCSPGPFYLLSHSFNEQLATQNGTPFYA